MRESTTKDSSGVAANEASTSKTVKYLEDELDDQTFIDYSDKCVIDKKFDDSCFKTPMLPHKRSCNFLITKKRLNGEKSNCSIDDNKVELSLTDSGRNSSLVSSSMSRLSIETLEDSLFPTSSNEMNDKKKKNVKEELLDVFVSIGKHSYLCPRSRQYFASEFPNLPQKRHQDDQDLLKEIIIDEFSLLLFNSIEDYNILKMHEDQLKRQEDEEEKRKAYEENIRSGKLKKKGRKNKLDTEKEVEKEKRELRTRMKLERREARRLRKEEKERKRRERAERRERFQHLNADEKLIEKRREQKEKRNAILIAASVSADETNVKSGARELKESRKTGREMERQLRREQKLQEKLLKQQLKTPSLNSLTSVANTSNITQPINNNISVFSSTTPAEYPLLTCNLEASIINNISSTPTSTTPTISNLSNSDNHYSENVPSSMAASLLGLGIRHESSNALALNGNISFSSVNDWSLLKDYQSLASVNTNKSECSSTASTSSSTLTPILTPVTSSLTSGLGVKRPSSAIGIAQRNSIILSPINNLEDRNCLQSETPLNKIRKIETNNSEIIKAYNNLTGICDFNGKLVNSTPPNSLIGNAELKSDTLLENGFACKNSVINTSNASNNNQSSMLVSKGVSSTCNTFNNQSSITSSVNNLATLSTSNLLSVTSTTTFTPSMIVPSTISASINSVAPNSLLAGIPGMNLSTIGSLGSFSTNNDHVSANFLQQSLLFNPELAALFNLHQQQQNLQQAQQLNEAICNNASDSTQQHSLMSAAVAAMGFPFFGVQSQFLTPQQQQQQLEQIQKQNQLLNSMQQCSQNGTIIRPNSVTLSVPNSSNSNTNTVTSLATTNLSMPPSLLYGENNNALTVSNGHLPLASQLASVAVLGKTPFLPNLTSSQQQQQRKIQWSDRHVSIAMRIAKYNELLKTKQQTSESKLLQQNKTITSTQQSQVNVSYNDSLALLNNVSNNSFVGINRQTTSASNLLNASQIANFSGLNNNSVSHNNFQNNNSFTSASQAIPNFSLQQQQKMTNSTSAIITNTKNQQEQQQLMQMAALKQQQKNVQQQKMQIEALRRFQQQQLSGNAQQQNFLAQFQQQRLAQLHQQRLKSTSTPGSVTHQQQVPLPSQTPMSAAVAAAAAQQLLSPSLNSPLFFSNASKVNLTSNTLASDLSKQQQKHFLSQLPTQLNNSFATVNPQQFIPSTSTSAALAAFCLPLTQPNINAQQQLNFSTPFNSGSGGSLTTGTSAQAHAAALANASVNNQTNNLIGLNQSKNTSSSTSNALAQIAMAQLMMQQINPGVLSNNIIPTSQINSISSQQQITATNNFLASLGLTSVSGANGIVSTSHLMPNISNGGINLNSQQRASISTQASSAGETTASITPTTSSINTVTVQQQQELLLQAALIQGIQSVS